MLFRSGNQFILDLSPDPTVSLLTRKITFAILHQRLGHLGYQNLRKLVNLNMADGIVIDKSESSWRNPKPCDACMQGKSSRLPFIDLTSRVSRPFEKLFADVAAPWDTADPGKNRYLLTVLDDYSRFSWVYPMQQKSASAQLILNLFKFIHNLLGY